MYLFGINGLISGDKYLGLACLIAWVTALVGQLEKFSTLKFVKISLPGYGAGIMIGDGGTPY